MNYSQYYELDVINGPGTRCTLFVSGCEHQCRGCYNQSTWSKDNGHFFTAELEQKIIDDLNDTRIRRRGLSLSGGDPLHPANIDGILRLVLRVKSECPGKDIWVWTGYKIDELTDQQKLIVQHVNTVIDGKYIAEQADPSLIFRGSANQRICSIKASSNSTNINYEVEK